MRKSGFIFRLPTQYSNGWPNASWALMSVAGDWAYIPSDWKAIGDEDPTLGVPTTYYGAVQVTGAVTVTETPDQVAECSGSSWPRFEPTGQAADPLTHTKKLRAIRGVKLPLSQVRAKFKYERQCRRRTSRRGGRTARDSGRSR